MSNRGRIILKALVTVILLSFLVYRMDLGEFVRVFASADWALVFAAGVLHLGTVPPSVARWKAILVHFGIGTPFRSLTQIAMIGYFFNMFLPSAVGGDFFRAYYLSKRESRGMSTTLTTTVVDRVSGLAAMLLIGATFVLLYSIRVHGHSLLPLLLLLAGAFALGLTTLFHRWTHRLFSRVLRRLGLEELDRKVQLAADGLNRLRRSGRTILLVVAASLLIQFAVIVAMWLAALSIGIVAPFYLFMIFIPLVNLSVALPITINGMGLREGMYYLLFSELGVAVEAAVTLSLLNLIVVAMTAVPGGVVYSLYKREEGFPVMKPEGG